MYFMVGGLNMMGDRKHRSEWEVPSAGGPLSLSLRIKVGPISMRRKEVEQGTKCVR
jgi:hypothetical protein